MTTNFTLPTRVDKESYVPCQNDRESSPPHYILDNEFHNPHNHIFFTKKGEMPHVSFEQNEIYRVVEKYYYIELTLNSYKFQHDFDSIKQEYINRNINLFYLIGKKSHTEEAQKIYLDIFSQMEITAEKYHHFLTRLIGKMLFLGNSIKVIIEDLDLHIAQSPSCPFQITMEDFYDCYEDYLLQRPYAPIFKCVVFNPTYHVNNCYKSVVMQRELSKLNSMNIKESYKNNLSVQQMAEENKTSTKTVKRHLQKLGISMKGAKKENTINQIKSYRKKHPKSTQKETSEALNLSIITVKRNWL